MKKQLALLFLSITVVACQQETSSLEAKRLELDEKQKELGEIESAIELLEEEIAALDSNKVDNATPVSVKVLETEKFEHFVKLTGTVTSRENIMISAETNGRIESVPAVEGTNVSKGAVLVRIENDIVASQLEEAKSSLDLAKLTYNKRKNLWDKNIGSEIEYLQAKNAYETALSRYAQVEEQYDNTVIKAPINGTVDDISVKEGEFVSVGTPIGRVVDLKKVEIEAELSENYLRSVKRGDSVEVIIPALGTTIKAPVTFVSQVINPDNRSFKIKVKLSNKEGLIKPNVLANLMIMDYKNDEAIVVPSNAINNDLRGEYVYVVASEEGKTVSKKRYVNKGRSFGPNSEVLEGLKEADKVITVGFNQVNDGEHIQVD